MKKSSRTLEDILEAWSELTFSGCFFITLPISASPFIYVPFPLFDLSFILLQALTQTAL